MPYYSWKGVDVGASVRKGTLFARSPLDVDQFLFEKRDIALIEVKEIMPTLLSGTVSTSHKIQLFRQLAVLLEAGVLLPEALHVLSVQEEHVRLQEVLHGLLYDVQEGVALSCALAKYPSLFTYLMIQLIEVGYRAGNLSMVLWGLSSYLESLDSFNKKLRSAAFLPLVTFGFFLVISLVIFVFVVPRFETIFASLGQDLPLVTSVVLGMSSFVRDHFFAVVGGLVCLIGACVYGGKRLLHRAQWVDRALLNMPFIAPIIIKSSVAHYVQALSLLLKSGMPIVAALTLSKRAIHNRVLAGHFEQVEHDVSNGYALSQALSHLPEGLLGYDVIALIVVGEKSRHVSEMLEKVAVMYRDSVDQSLWYCTTVFQPLVMVILGLLVTLLVFAVYLPVMQLGQVI